jgi:hypothetical protein
MMRLSARMQGIGKFGKVAHVQFVGKGPVITGQGKCNLLTLKWDGDEFE